MSAPKAPAPLTERLASAHGLNWRFDPKYRWAWYVWPQTVAVLAAAWLLAGMPDVIPHGGWNKPAETAGAQMDQLRDAAKKDTAARDRLKRLAEAGDPFAQFSYATLFDPIFKNTDNLDINTALEWYLKAANQNHANAQLNYGWRNFYGEAGLPVDRDKGFPWLLKAAQQGVVDAQSAVGEAYRDGKGTKQDLVTAYKWLQTAADKGSAFSQAEIGDAYAEGKGGYDKNIGTAITWYRKSADQKSSYSQRKLGLIYLNGTDGTQRDPATAYDFLKKAAEAGDLIAQYNLGTMYQKGIFVKEDLSAAIGWFRKSADQGWNEAQNAMGVAYLTGVGVDKDKDAAKSWFEKAAAGGNQEAAASLKSMGAAVPTRKDTVTTDNKPVTPANPSETDAASICLNEDNPNTASSMCQVFLGNNANLSNATKTAVYNKLALASLRLKDYGAVVSWAKKSLDITSSPVEHYVAGQAYAAQKDWKRAVDEFTAAISMAPKYVLAFHRRGEAYLQMGDTARAKSDFETVLSINAKFLPSVEGLKRVKKRG
jgi:TPR repeat protein